MKLFVLKTVTLCSLSFGWATLFHASHVKALVFSPPRVQKEGGLREFEQKVHQDSLKFSAVCLVRIECWEKGADKSEKKVIYGRTGTGVYFRDSVTQDQGYVLTAAHVLWNDRLFDGRVFISFHPDHSASRFDNISEQPEFIPVKRFTTHPQYQWDSVKDSESNDLALLTFPLSRLPKGVTPLPLYTGTGYTKRPFLEAMVVGYGGFRVNDPSSDFPPISNKRYAGKTFVTYDKKHLLPTPVFYQLLFSPDPNSIFFADLSLIDKREDTGETIDLIKVHPEQVSLHKGDSGSPLLFWNEKQFKIAGITIQKRPVSGSIPGIEGELKEDLNQLTANVWLPLPLFQDWIKETILFIEQEPSRDEHRPK